ncbi:hypothetical protein CHARACLAT_012891 [Characodon lateralis]|uniref:Uncharacterized protein n=1 Tax=Characodon lateralis TaxID=208331 RepID=A0ABU7DR21_9TELE|nr:hypothetical protein [Characodon lateralis]
MSLMVQTDSCQQILRSAGISLERRGTNKTHSIPASLPDTGILQRVRLRPVFSAAVQGSVRGSDHSGPPVDLCAQLKRLQLYVGNQPTASCYITVEWSEVDWSGVECPQLRICKPSGHFHPATPTLCIQPGSGRIL